VLDFFYAYRVTISSVMANKTSKQSTKRFTIFMLARFVFLISNGHGVTTLGLEPKPGPGLLFRLG